MVETSRKIYIGTSGWHYKHWRGKFYPEGLPAAKWLDFYCQYFDSLELNNTFYRLPPRTALEAWRDATPANFLFAVKGSRFITHMKKLKDPEPALERFFDRANVLGKKTGPILFQLPPRWDMNIERFAQFLSVLPRAHRYAFEFRDEDWNREPVYELLRKHRAAYCIFHLAGTQSPMEVTADFVYIRLHGPGGKYQGSYSHDELSRWARRIETWQSDGRTIYVYFDNDDSGYAAKNALMLKELCAAIKPIAG